jgi:hypothetical protein
MARVTDKNVPNKAGKEKAWRKAARAMALRRNFEPMTLANMRENGVRVVVATCSACGREADVKVDALDATTPVPEAARRLKCSKRGGKRIRVSPMAYGPRQVRPSAAVGAQRERRGNTSTALAGSVAALRGILLRRLSSLEIKRTGGPKEDGIGRDAILNELRGMPGVNEHIVRQQVSNLKSSGEPKVAWRSR